MVGVLRQGGLDAEHRQITAAELGRDGNAPADDSLDTGFDGYRAQMATASKTCSVRYDRNRYSVSSSAVSKPVEFQAYTDRVVIRHQGQIVAAHQRCFGRDQMIYDPWHFVPVLARKPGALRNGAPFQDWDLPDSLRQVRAHFVGCQFSL